MNTTTPQTYLSKDKMDINDVLKVINFPVERQEIQTISGKTIERKKAIVRTDCNIPLSVVSDRYQLLTNKDVFTLPLTVLNNESGYINARTSLDNMGQKTHVELISRDDYHTKGTTKDEVYKKRIVLENSYDGKTSLRVLFGSWRVICKNGAGIWIRKQEAVRFFHMGFNDVKEIRKQIQSSLMVLDKKFDEYMDNISILEREKIAKVERLKDIFAMLRVGKTVQSRINEKLEEQGKALNFLMVYNAFTEYQRDMETKKQRIIVTNMRRSSMVMSSLL